MSSVYQSKIQKHSSFLQKIIEESGKSDNPNIINMINELSNSVIKDIDNLKAIIKKPGENNNKRDEYKNRRFDNGSNANELEENGEQINNLNNKGMKRTLSDYVKIYKPAQKVKKINDNSKEIEIYFSEKSDKEFEEENGKAFQEDEYESNLNHHLKEFERNSSKPKLKTLLTTSFQVEIRSNSISKKSCSTNNIISALNPLVLKSLEEKESNNVSPDFSQHSHLQSALNGNNNNFNNEFIEKLFNENYNFKHETQNLKNKILQLKSDNEKLKSKLKKYIQQTEFLEKKLETYKVSNGGSTNYLFSNNNNNVNSSTSSLLPKQAEFERLYYEKCEEFENFEQNFNKISDKFSDVLEKIQAYQWDLLEDNKRLKEFLIFILQCCNHRQYEHISCLISYAKENQTFLGKQILEAPVGESFKGLVDKSYLAGAMGAKSPNPKVDLSLNNNNNKKEIIQQEYYSSEEDDPQTKLISKASLDNVKSALSLGLKYDDLKFSKTVSEKIGVSNKNSSCGLGGGASAANNPGKSSGGFDTRNKSPGPSPVNSNNASNSVNVGAYGVSGLCNVNNNNNNNNNLSKQGLKENKSKEFSYTELMKLSRQKSINKDSPPDTLSGDNNIATYSKLNAASHINASNNNTSLNITRDSKNSYTNSPFRIRQESIVMDKDLLKDNLNFNLNNSYMNRTKSPFSVSSRTYNFVEVANQNGDNNINNTNSLNKNCGNNNNFVHNNNLNNNNNNNQNGNTTIDLNFNISSHLKHNDSIISDSFNHDVSQSNLRDLVNLSNSTNLNNGISNMKRFESSKNSYPKGNVITSNSNKFYIGKNKNETLYSEIMMKKDHSPMSNLRSSNPSNATFTNTSRNPFYNNNPLKK